MQSEHEETIVSTLYLFATTATTMHSLVSLQTKTYDTMTGYEVISHFMVDTNFSSSSMYTIKWDLEGRRVNIIVLL